MKKLDNISETDNEKTMQSLPNAQVPKETQNQETMDMQRSENLLLTTEFIPKSSYAKELQQRFEECQIEELTPATNAINGNEKIMIEFQKC